MRDTRCDSFRTRDMTFYEKTDSLLFLSADSLRRVVVLLSDFEKTTTYGGGTPKVPNFCTGNVRVNFTSNWGGNEVVQLKFGSSYNDVTEYRMGVSAEKGYTFSTKMDDWAPPYYNDALRYDSISLTGRQFYGVIVGHPSDTTLVNTPVSELLFSNSEGLIGFFAQNSWFFKE